MRTPLLLALTLMTLPACKGEGENNQVPKAAAEAQPPAEAQAPAEAQPGAETQPPSEPAPVDEASAKTSGDYLEIIANHEPKKPSDPAVMRLTGIKVLEADFDPKKLEGASATFEIDLTSLSSKVPDRDDHLKSEDFLDVEQFPIVTVAVSNVKAVDDGYTAQATVSAKGVAAKWMLQFEAVDVTDTSVRIKGSHAFGRSIFKIGEPGHQADELTANWDISLEKN